ncbi:hypothetical protein HRG_014078 [Hirsutella rhossiliensis]
MWFKLLREGSWYAFHNILKSLMNAFCFLIGIIILVCGTYASLVDIIHHFRNGKVRGVFTCAPITP